MSIIVKYFYLTICSNYLGFLVSCFLLVLLQTLCGIFQLGFKVKLSGPNFEQKRKCRSQKAPVPCSEMFKLEKHDQYHIKNLLRKRGCPLLQLLCYLGRELRCYYLLIFADHNMKFLFHSFKFHIYCYEKLTLKKSTFFQFLGIFFLIRYFLEFGS